MQTGERTLLMRAFRSGDATFICSDATSPVQAAGAGLVGPLRSNAFFSAAVGSSLSAACTIDEDRVKSAFLTPVNMYVS